MSTTPIGGAGQARTEGWAIFVAVFLMIAGILNVIWGVAALENRGYFISGGLLWSSLETWGWTSIVVGGVQVLASLLVMVRNIAGAIIAGVLAVCGIVLNFLSIGAYPVWSATLLVVDALVIWGVTVHIEEFVKEQPLR